MMKAMSIWQPWSSLMAAQLKRNETRGWRKNFRGELVICSSKQRRWPSYASAAMGWLWSERDRFPGCHGNLKDLFYSLPFGCALCVVRVVDCVPVESIEASLGLRERALGDYSPGRFAWQTEMVKVLRVPVPVLGRQGLFNLKPEEARRVKEQM
jgi:hypothetical protein